MAENTPYALWIIKHIQPNVIDHFEGLTHREVDLPWFNQDGDEPCVSPCET
jgi:hypothetical protein